jgi:hypothetical protein
LPQEALEAFVEAIIAAARGRLIGIRATGAEPSVQHQKYGGHHWRET